MFPLTSTAIQKRELRSLIPDPVIVPVIDSYVWSGCYAEGDTSRALKDTQYLDVFGMTVDSCVDSVKDMGYGFAGLKSSPECHCGTQMD